MAENKVELTAISSKFTEEILKICVAEYYKRKVGKEAAEILDYNVVIASGKGDGYMGVVYRITINLKDNNKIRLIGKGMPSNLTRRKAFHCETFFANEVFFFNEVLKLYLELEKEKRGIKKNEMFKSILSVPDCYYAMSNGVDDFLVLEDLTQDGYISEIRNTNLTVNQINEMLKLLARLHAFSLATKYYYPEKFKLLTDRATETLFPREYCLWDDKYLTTLPKYFRLAIKDEFSSVEESMKYMDKFDKFTTIENFNKKIFYTVETKVEKSVFNHGDTWITNFMFKNKSIIKLIDFQILRYGSPILDLSTLIFACTNKHERDNLGGIKGILEIYQTELNHILTTIFAIPNSFGYTLDELLNDWKEFAALGFGFSIELVQLSLIDENDVESLDRFDDGDISLADITSFAEIKTKEGKKRIADILKLAVDTGVI